MSTTTGQPGEDAGKTPVAPLTRWSKFVVVVGFLCLLGSAAALIWGDEKPYAQCSTETTEVPPTSATTSAAGPSGSAASPTSSVTPTPAASVSPTSAGPPARPDGDDEPDLTVTQKVTKCSPSDLKGGLALLLGVVGLVFMLPGLLRILPEGDYEGPGGFRASTTGPANQQEAARAAKVSAEALRDAFRELMPTEPAPAPGPGSSDTGPQSAHTSATPPAAPPAKPPSFLARLRGKLPGQ